MSTMTKVLIVLMLAVAAAKLGMDAALFSHRIDWKDKWVKAENWRVEIERIKNQEIGELNIHIQNLMTGIGLLQREKEKLEETIRNKESQIEVQENDKKNLEQQLAETRALHERTQQQLNVQIATAQRLQELAEEHRNNAERALARAAEAEMHQMNQGQEIEEKTNLVAELEKKVVVLAKAKADLEDQIGKINRTGGGCGIIISEKPSRKIDGKIISYNRELGAVVINVGREDGVLEGMSFSIFRPGKFVARAAVKNVDRNMSVAHIELMQSEPEPGDECTNGLPLSNK